MTSGGGSSSAATASKHIRSWSARSHVVCTACKRFSGMWHLCGASCCWCSSNSARRHSCCLLLPLLLLLQGTQLCQLCGQVLLRPVLH
jgi:hypothetical protein